MRRIKTAVLGTHLTRLVNPTSPPKSLSVVVLFMSMSVQASLVQHLDATVPGSVNTNRSKAVSRWVDQSGLANDGVSDVGSVFYPSDSRFASGEVGLDFSTGRKSLALFSAAESASWLNSGSGFCVIVAFKVEAMEKRWNDLFGNSSTVSSGFGLRYSSSGSMQAYLGGTSINKHGNSVTVGDTIVFSFNYNAATNAYEFWDSKNDSTAIGTITAADFSTSNPVTLGSTQNKNRYFDGLVGEVKVYDAVLSARELSREQVSMVYKWIIGQPGAESLAAPSGLIAMPYDTQVSLNWEENSGLQTFGYNVWRALSRGGPYTRIATEHLHSHFTDFDLVNDTTYYYKVTAVDVWGDESDYSNEVSGTPQPRPTVKGGDLDYGAYYGYQAWHLCEGDGSPRNRWIHWFRENTPDAEHIHSDMWPDMSEYPEDELFDTQMVYPDGRTVRVYSAYRYSTIDLHIKWMKEYGLKGCFLQWFVDQIPSTWDGQSHLGERETIAQHVRTACEKYGIKFCLMPCAATGEYSTEKVIRFWKHCVDKLRITESPQYIYQNGKPVIGFWGLGFTPDVSTITPLQASETLDFLQNAEEQKYHVYVMGGVERPWGTHAWRNNRQDEWVPVFHRLDMISPWRTLFKNPVSEDLVQLMVDDLAYCRRHDLDYCPVVSPGDSSYNLHDNPALLNWRPREGGHFLWKQVYEVCRMGSKFMYVAMFDEIDEGTAMYKQAPTLAECPMADGQVPLDYDGYDLPSDWYLRIGTEIQKMLDGRIPLTPNLPLDPSQSSRGRR